jgi:hypothetical protein
MYRLQDFLESTTDPHYGGSFRWGRPMVGHSFTGMGLDPFPFEPLKEMAAHIDNNAPPGEDNRSWQY